jgi:phytoene dehydrogenase-like protein
VARVIIVGAGIAGLSAAIHASSYGHHVVLLEKSSRIGGRGTSQNVDGFSLHYGPHLLDKKGPFYQLCHKLSRTKISLKPLRLDKIEAAGHGLIRPTGNIKQAAENLRALRNQEATNPYFQAVSFLTNWGGRDNQKRSKSLRKGKLCISNEGWIGLVGRLGAALDEIGVLIETNCEIANINKNKVCLTDGREVECDAVILACGVNMARQLLESVDEDLTRQEFANLNKITASFIEAGISSKPMSGKHAIVNPDSKMAVFDNIAIQPRLGAGGSHISAIAVGGLNGASKAYQSAKQRSAKLADFLDKHISGWQDNIVTDLRQSSIIVSYQGSVDGSIFAKNNILLAGQWVSSDYVLSDAAADTGKSAAKAVTQLHPTK